MKNMGDYTKLNAVKPKKALGQHFLVDLDIARNIVGAMSKDHDVVIEVGAGMGVLTQYIIEDQLDKLKIVEIDGESVDYLLKKFPMLDGHIVFGDFLKYDIASLAANGQRTTEAAPLAALGRNDVPDGGGETKDVAVIGNFPYNISSQIFFQILKYRDYVTESVGMLQKEVAERLAAGPGSKTYGILSVLLQAYYDIEYLFTVHENVFNPPPKVKSAVIRLRRNGVKELGCDEKLFVAVVKQAFNQRRKTMRNSLRSMIPAEMIENEIFDKRPEQLSVADFVELTKMLEE